MLPFRDRRTRRNCEVKQRSARARQLSTMRRMGTRRHGREELAGCRTGPRSGVEGHPDLRWPGPAQRARGGASDLLPVTTQEARPLRRVKTPPCRHAKAIHSARRPLHPKTPSAFSCPLRWAISAVARGCSTHLGSALPSLSTRRTGRARPAGFSFNRVPSRLQGRQR